MVNEDYHSLPPSHVGRMAGAVNSQLLKLGLNANSSIYSIAHCYDLNTADWHETTQRSTRL